MEKHKQNKSRKNLKTGGRSKLGRPLLTVSGVILTILIAIKSNPLGNEVSIVLQTKLIPWCVVFLMLVIVISLISLNAENWKSERSIYPLLDILASAIFFIAMIFFALIITI